MFVEVGKDKVPKEDRAAVDAMRTALDAGELGQEGFVTSLRLGGRTVEELKRIVVRAAPRGRRLDDFPFPAARGTRIRVVMRLGRIIVVLALVVAGCGDSGLTEGAEGGDVTVTNHPALLFSPPWIAAADQKLFEKNGLNVKQIVGSEGGGTTVRNVVSGGLPIGEVATTAAVTAFQAGADIRIVGGGVASSKDVLWVTQPDSKLDSIEDLRGKEVGYTSPGSVTQGLLALSLERSGVGVDNVKMRSMGGLPEGLTALKNGDIDAAAILEPVMSEQVKEERWKPVFQASEYVPEFLSTVIISGPGVLEKDPELVKRTVAARADGIEFLKRDPEAVAKAWAKEAEIKP